MKIDFLINHIDSVSLISRWYFHEWKAIYEASGMSLEDVERSVRERANADRFPLPVVGLEDGYVVATGCLKVHDMDTRRDLTPWLAGIYVGPDQRQKGHGSLIVKALEDIGRGFGISKLYLYTPRSALFYKKLGWDEYEVVQYKDHQVTIMKREWREDAKIVP